MCVDAFKAPKKKERKAKTADAVINNAALFVGTVQEVGDAPEGRRGGNERRHEAPPELSSC